MKNPCAFPREDYQTDGSRGQTGMTLRDWFAGEALGLVAVLRPASSQYVGPDEIACLVYQIADAMLAERGKGEISTGRDS